MEYTRCTTCEITAYHVGDLPGDGVTPTHQWLAIATSHIYNPSPDTGGLLNSVAAVAAGAVMTVIEGKASATSEAAAMRVALENLLFQIAASAERRRGSDRA